MSKKNHITSRIVLTFIALFVVTFTGVFTVSGTAHAANTDGTDNSVIPAYQKILGTEICPALKKIKGQKLYDQNCRTFQTQSDMNSAEKAICKKYGDKELKDECDSYDNYRADNSVIPGYQEILGNKLCPALKKIKGETLDGKTCRTFQTQTEVDGAAKKICDKYGKTQLKDECKAYDDYSPGAPNNPDPAPAASTGGDDTYSLGGADTPYYCGAPGNRAIKTSIDLGCQHKGSASIDLSFAIIRFLSDGAGLVLIGSLIWAGIQYTMTQGDPQASAAAQNRIRSTVAALGLFIFAYAILNYLIPGKFLQ